MGSDAQQDGESRALSTRRLDHDFSVVLARTIESVQQDPAQFRNLIYEMARVQLQREAWRQNPPMNILELRRMMLALETAIERVETRAAHGEVLPAFSSGALIEGPAQQAVVVIDQQSGPVPARADPVAHALAITRTSAPIRALLRLGVLAVLAAAVVIVADRKFHLLRSAPTGPLEHIAASADTPPAQVAAVPAQPAPPPRPSSGPLPSVYGVYAVSGDRLYELTPLVGRAPDLRVFMSSVLKTPSQTVLPDGQLSFIVYRRDIASSAPDRVSVRVIAKVARALTFSKSGQPTTVDVDGEWAVRNVSYDYRVAPSTDSPEMIVIKPESGAPALAAGRYALVVKGQMFDFTVDGPITQAAHCLERTEAMNGSFYSECRHVR